MPVSSSSDPEPEPDESSEEAPSLDPSEDETVALESGTDFCATDERRLLFLGDAGSVEDAGILEAIDGRVLLGAFDARADDVGGRLEATAAGGTAGGRGADADADLTAGGGAG